MPSPLHEQQLQAMEEWRSRVATAQEDADKAFFCWNCARNDPDFPDGELAALHSEYMQKRQRVIMLGGTPRRHPGEPGR